MGIIRKYETKADCAQLLVNERFDMLDSTLITELYGWNHHWKFVAEYNDELCDEPCWYDEDENLAYYESEYTTNGAPAWNTWFEPADSWIRGWCMKNLDTLAKCGFVIILHDDEFWGLAVDGAGYSFYEAHWIPLYEAMGLKWHE